MDIIFLKVNISFFTTNFSFSIQLFKNVAERGRIAQMLMEAHEAYRAGNIDTALLKYAMLAELGYEVAQSNVAFILDHGKFLSLRAEQHVRNGLAFLYYCYGFADGK